MNNERRADGHRISAAGDWEISMRKRERLYWQERVYEVDSS
jgi:hypothetical protein